MTDNADSEATVPTVLFLCTHNAGRSQMAMGFFKHLVGERAAVYSGGSEPADHVNPAAVAVMAEKGIDIGAQQPTHWTSDIVEMADVVITMGCGDTCPILPGRRYEEWVLADPAGLTTDEVRPIRDDIERRAWQLLGRLDIEPGGSAKSRG
jgi:arsenate reductase